MTQRKKVVEAMRQFAVAAEENSEYDTMQDFDAAASMLEADQARIATQRQRIQFCCSALTSSKI